MKEIILILGGARSGKSAYADRLARESGRPVVYVATATAGDAEMAARIAAHKATRPPGWQTVEAPLNVAESLAGQFLPGGLVLLDCLTLLANNVLFSLPEPVSEAGFQAALEHEVSQLVEAFRSSPADTLILVSNEVGLGIVPEYELGRLYRDVLGRLNQELARQADTAWLMVAGLPMRLK